MTDADKKKTEDEIKWSAQKVAREHISPWKRPDPPQKNPTNDKTK